jgi:hypothetical protein
MTRNKPWRADIPATVIVARPTKWGNRFVVGDRYLTTKMSNAKVKDRAHAVHLFQDGQLRRMNVVAQLRSKDLALVSAQSNERRTNPLCPPPCLFSPGGISTKRKSNIL